MYESEAILISPDRSGFMNQVLFYFGLALGISGIGVYLAPQIIPMNSMAVNLCFVAELILIFTARMWSQIKPWNIVLFGAFAFLSGITIYPLLAFAALQGGTILIYKALFATLCMFTAAAMYGYVTSRNLASLSGFLMMTLIGLIVVGILQIFWYSSTVELIASGVGIVLFSLFTAFDIQRLKLYPETLAIEAALHLYLDIFNMFISILRFMLVFGRE